MKNPLTLSAVLLFALIASPEVFGTEEEDPRGAEQYVAAIRSVGDVKRRLLAHLNPKCGTGSCVENNAGEVCKLVAALDIRAGGVITASTQPTPGADLAIAGGDLQLMRRIWRQCKPTSEGFWRHGELLRVTYQGDDKEITEVSSALRAAASQGRKGDTPRAVKEPVESKELSACLLSEAERGAYSSFDGGRSALSLLKACQLHVSKWLDSCAADGEASDQCAQKALVLGQVALKFVGK